MGSLRKEGHADLTWGFFRDFQADFYVDYILTGYSTPGDVGSCWVGAAVTWIEARGTWRYGRFIRLTYIV